MRSANAKRRKGRLAGWSALLALGLLTWGGQASAIRIKDVTKIKGVRENWIFGRGLVIGLNGTGDGTSNEFTAQALANYLRETGLTVSVDDMNLKNVAMVVVTAVLPPFARPGDRIDVTVSSMGDAGSIQGGTLLKTVLSNGPGGEIFAEAQGPISVGGFSAGAGGTSVTKGHVTVGRIPGGAMVEKASPVILAGREVIELILLHPDFTTAHRIAEEINHALGGPLAEAISAAEVTVRVPLEFRARLTEFIASIERLPVNPDHRARVVVNERTGTVVISEDVRISTLALAHGNLTIQISQVNQISQPEAFSRGETTPLTQTGISAQEESRDLAVLNEGVTLGEVVASLNAIGVTPRDLIAILQLMDSLGALQAELVIE